MKTIWTAAVVGGLCAALLAGCPPSEGTSAPGTGAGEVGGGSAVTATGAAAPVAAVADDAVVKQCLAVTDKIFTECSADAAPAVIGVNLKSGMMPPEIVEKSKTPDGMKSLVDMELAEMKANGAEPKRTEMCTTMAAKMADVIKPDMAAIDACVAKADCKERVACFTPIMEKHMTAMKDKMGDVMKDHMGAGAGSAAAPTAPAGAAAPGAAPAAPAAAPAAPAATPAPAK
jgi:hypothetical protein